MFWKIYVIIIISGKFEDHGWLPIREAAAYYRGCEKLAKILIKHGDDLDALANIGFSPLQISALYGNLTVFFAVQRTCSKFDSNRNTCQSYRSSRFCECVDR